MSDLITPSKHVKCIKTIEDQSGRYCLEGKIYEVKRWRDDENWMEILAEGNILLIKNMDDNCFEFID
jgi:hypothetical protein